MVYQLRERLHWAEGYLKENDEKVWPLSYLAICLNGNKKKNFTIYQNKTHTSTEVQVLLEFERDHF